MNNTTTNTSIPANSITVTNTSTSNNPNSTSTLAPNVKRFAALADELIKLYELKNKAYGNSFSTSVQAYGLIAALTRISDKFRRLENLILHPSTEVGDERIADTLRDLASYCLMTVMEVEK